MILIIFFCSNITKEKIEQTKKTKAETEKLRIENSKRILRLPQFDSKVNKINQFTHQHLEALEQNRLKLNQKLRLLSMKRKEYLSELSTYIFPIGKYNKSLNILDLFMLKHTVYLWAIHR